MLMSSGGYAASSSGCVTRPRAREIGSTGYAGPTQHSLLIGRYVMATAEHREPCDSRGSRTVLGAPGGEIPSGDSTPPPVSIPRFQMTAFGATWPFALGRSFGAAMKSRPQRHNAGRAKSFDPI